MNININKDFEKEYKDDSWRGFSMEEVLYIGAALGIMGAVSFFFYYQFHLPLNMVLYLGLPPAAPILLLGFFRYYGLRLTELMKEIWYEKKIKNLSYEAGEYVSMPEKMDERFKKKR